MKTDLIICVWAWGASKPNDKKSGSEAGSVHNRLIKIENRVSLSPADPDFYLHVYKKEVYRPWHLVAYEWR